MMFEGYDASFDAVMIHPQRCLGCSVWLGADEIEESLLCANCELNERMSAAEDAYLEAAYELQDSHQ